MAQQNTVNVESQVGQSVVPSTTDDDASKTATSLTAGEKSADRNSITQPNGENEKKSRKEVGDGGSSDQDTQVRLPAACSSIARGLTVE